MGQSRCHYEVFCAENAPMSPVPESLLKALAGLAKWSRVTPKTDAKRWSAAPNFLVGDAAKKQPPVPLTGTAATSVNGLMKRLGVCFVITAEGPSMTPFQAALAMATSAIDHAGAEFIVDQTASLGMLGEEMKRQNELLNVKSQIDPIESVTASIDKGSLLTSGLCKFGEPEITIGALEPTEYQAAHDLLYQRLLLLSIGEGLKKGLQTVDGARLFVTLGADGRYHVSDCDPKTAAPIKGLKKYISARSQATSKK